MSEPIENKPAEANPAEMKAAPCGKKMAALSSIGIGAVAGAVVGLLTKNIAVWLPLGTALGFIFGGVMRGGGG